MTRFADGELFDAVFETSRGHVGFLAEVALDGRTLHLKDVVVEPVTTGRLSVGTAEVRVARAKLIEWAREAGFQHLRITGERLTGANTGRSVDVVIDLSN